MKSLCKLNACNIVALFTGALAVPHYKLTSPSGKSYHGITTSTVSKRLKKHCDDARRGSKGLLHRAICKYGIENFKIEILNDTCDRATLIRLEVEGIARDNTFNPRGYNMTLGGDGASGRLLNKASRQLLAEARNKNWADEGYREKMLTVVSNLPNARKIAKALKSPEQLLNETEKRSISLKLAWEKPGHRELCSGDAHAAKLSAARAARSPQTIQDERDRRVAAAKARWDSPGHREKVAASKAVKRETM